MVRFPCLRCALLLLTWQRATAVVEHSSGQLAGSHSGVRKLCCRTPDEVTVFEALVTLLGFPALVFVSFKVDQFEAAAARRKRHLVETQTALKPDGWVGFGGDEGETVIPLRVLDEQGGRFLFAFLSFLFFLCVCACVCVCVWWVGGWWWWCVWCVCVARSEG